MSPNPPYLVFDGHNDAILSLARPGRGGARSFFERSERGHLDLPRAREGGFGGGFFALFVPSPPDPAAADLREPAPGDHYAVPLPPPLEQDYAQRTTLSLMARLFRIEAASGGQLRIVRDTGQLAACLRDGVVAAVLHIEGAEAIDPDLDALEVYYQAGLRSLGLVWSRANRFAQGVPFAYPQTPDTGPGLTEDGRSLVRRCNALHILLDLSHLNEQGFWDVARHSQAPLVATHSNAHALCPVTRNLTDRQLDAIRDSDGMVGVNFSVSFLRRDGGLDPDTPLATVVEHVTYLVERLGADRVGIGSDFDGARLPRAIGDVTGLPRLFAALADAGFDDATLRKLAHENWLRVLRATWEA